ncbi:ATP-binding protein [Streptomyces cavernae]|uniref:ATP-binding protein n=1 Tax=Streptomyces cavernae TaxID=2259034 RepID=UPI000FEBB3BF|nr:ATP-binding protein [Streptomyces cavernae]
MVRVQSPPGGREVPFARVLLLPAILMAAATGTAAALVAPSARIAVACCGAVATLLLIAVAAAALRRGRALRALRAEHAERTAALERRIAANDDEVLRLRTEILPATVGWVLGGEPVREVMRNRVDSRPEWRDMPDVQRELLLTVLRLISDEESRRDASQRSFVHVARRVQAICHQQAIDLREMEEDHGNNPEVFDNLLRLDHGNSMIGRLADSLGVIGGGGPGRRWPKPVTLYSTLRGAMSRILEYRRIKLDSIAVVNIAGLYVEPIIHIAAELMDNATRFSPPQSKVRVTATEVQTGIAIEFEDAGVKLTDERRQKIDTLLGYARAGIDMTQVGETPRLGMAVVGRLAKMYNIEISMRPSSYGGCCAVMVVPRSMLSTDPRPVGLHAHGIGAVSRPLPTLDGVVGPKRSPKKRRPTTGPRVPRPGQDPYDDDVPVVTEWTANGLPQRRSRVRTPLSERLLATQQMEAEQAAARAAAPAAPQEEEPPPGLWVEEFFEGLKGGPDKSAPDTGGDSPGRPDPASSDSRAELASEASGPAATAASDTDNQPAPVTADDEGDLK